MSTALTHAQLQEVERLINERVKPLEAAIQRLEHRLREAKARSDAGLARVASLERRSIPQAHDESPPEEPLGHDWFDEADLSTDYH